MYLIAFVAIVITVLGFMIRGAIYKKKIEKAFREKSWDLLPALIIKRHAFFGCIVAWKKYYRDYLKYLAQSGNLLRRETEPVLNVCERLFSQNEYDSVVLLMLVMRKLYFDSEADSLISTLKEPSSLRDAFLSYERKDYDRFMENEHLKTFWNADIRALRALLALKANQEVTIDEEIRSSPYFKYYEEASK